MLCDEPLRLALRNHHLDVAKTLLEAGANPNKRYFFGSEINLVSPLDLDCMELLLAFGAYANARDRAGLTPLMKAARLPQVCNVFLSYFLMKITILMIILIEFHFCHFYHAIIGSELFSIKDMLLQLV